MPRWNRRSLAIVHQVLPIFSDTYRRTWRSRMRVDAAMQTIRPKKAKKLKKLKHAATPRIPGRPAKPSPKLSGRGGRRAPAEIRASVGQRAQDGAAAAEART